MRRLLLLACVLLLAACGGGGEGTPPPAPSASAPPAPAPQDIGEDIAPVPSPQEPGVVVDLDADYLARATLSRDGRQYRADRVDDGWEVDGNPGADLGAWLERYAPLRADGRATGLAPDSVIFSPDAQVSFFFTDGSGRVVSYKRYGDSLAVVSQPDGPVYRLAPDRLEALVPPVEAFVP